MRALIYTNILKEMKPIFNCVSKTRYNGRDTRATTGVVAMRLAEKGRDAWGYRMATWRAPIGFMP